MRNQQPVKATVISAVALFVSAMLGACMTSGEDITPQSSSPGTVVVGFEEGQQFSLAAAMGSSLSSFGQVEHTLAPGSEAPVFALAGPGSENFRIDSQANLYLSQDASGINTPVSIRVVAYAAAGDSTPVATATISIINQAEAVLTIEPNQLFMLRSLTPSTTVAIGRLKFTARNLTGPLLFTFSGTGSELFEIDGLGRIYLQAPLATPASAYGIIVEGRQGTAAGPPLARETVVINAVNVSPQPQADFSARIASEEDRRRIVFAPIVPASLTPTSWHWDFGDGASTSSARAPTHKYARAGTHTVTLTIGHSAGPDIEVIHRVYPHESGDPLRPLQWYLDNDPLSPFAGAVAFDQRITHTLTSGEIIARAGEDIRAIDHLSACGVLDTCRGEGVVVQVVDRAAQLTHPDLIDNTRQGLSRNLLDDASSNASAFSQYNLSSPLNTFFLFAGEAIARNRTLAHGTAVSGIILARDLNGIGISGIAPRAELASYNYLDNQTDSVRIQALTDPGIDVSNNSWSVVSDPGTGALEYLPLPSAVRDAVEQAMAEERGGLGRLFFKSSGNSGTPSIPSRRVFGNRLNAAAEAFQNLRHVMSIGSIDADGEANSASEGGANILAVGYENPPCGSVTSSLFSRVSNPIAIVTTDPVGDIGSVYLAPPTLYAGTGDVLAWTPPSDILDYSYCFGGTSASSPMAAGAGALFLQARPDLSWRDIRAIIASAARRNDTNNSGWTTNGAGFSTHYVYGFGALNIETALELARTWKKLPAELAYDSGTMAVNAPIPDCQSRCATAPPAPADGSSYTTTITPATSIEWVESALVGVRISFAAVDGSAEQSRALRGTIAVSLEHIGANGNLLSSSVLHKYHPYYSDYVSPSDLDGQGGGGTAMLDWTFLSLRHFGETSSGTWRLRITDYVDDESSIRLESWSLALHGH